MESDKDKVKIFSPPPLGSGDDVVIDRIAGQMGTEGMTVSFVSFPPGAKRPWNNHDQDQYVWSLDGKGILFLEDGEIVFEAGRLVYIPAGLKHRHGAVEDEPFSQLSIIGGKKRS